MQVNYSLVGGRTTCCRDFHPKQNQVGLKRSRYVKITSLGRTACATHQWSSSYTVEEVEEALGVVDGWTEDGVWFTPLTIQILGVQITAIPVETDGAFVLRVPLSNLFSHTELIMVLVICFMIWCV